MKKRHLIVPVLALALSANSAMAQQTPPAGGPPTGMGGPGGGANRRMAALLQGITLTPAQQASIDSISTAFRGRMPAFTPGTPPDSAARAQRLQLTTERDAAMRSFLTPDQQRVWDTNLQNMPAMAPRPGN
jgi:Spy/CpxP family protein refolding chaperone